MRPWKLFLTTLFCAAGVQAVAQSPDSVMRCRTEEYIAKHVDELKFVSEEEGFTCAIFWTPLAGAGLSELAYRENYPYLFARDLEFRVGEKYRNARRALGSAIIWFTVDSVGRQTIDSLRFNAYEDRRRPGVMTVSRKRCRAIEQTVRECMDALSGAWTPIRDLTGRGYTCHCVVVVDVGGSHEHSAYAVSASVDLRPEFIPQLIGEDGYHYPQKVRLKKEYDARYEPYLRAGKLPGLDEKKTEEALKAAGLM